MKLVIYMVTVTCMGSVKLARTVQFDPYDDHGSLLHGGQNDLLEDEAQSDNNHGKWKSCVVSHRRYEEVRHVEAYGNYCGGRGCKVLEIREEILLFGM